MKGPIRDVRINRGEAEETFEPNLLADLGSMNPDIPIISFFF